MLHSAGGVFVSKKKRGFFFSEVEMSIVHTARETGSAHALIKYKRLLTFLVLAGLRRCAVVFHQLYKPPHIFLCSSASGPRLNSAPLARDQARGSAWLALKITRDIS